MANSYDAGYPAVIVEGGKVRVEGDGVIQWVDANNTFLIDPRETIPLERIAPPSTWWSARPGSTASRAFARRSRR